MMLNSHLETAIPLSAFYCHLYNLSTFLNLLPQAFFEYKFLSNMEFVF